MLNIETCAGRSALVNAVVESMTKLIYEAAENGKQFHLALTGGEVGGEIADSLAEKISLEPENFRGLHVWWSDERFVNSSSEDRNAFAFLVKLSPDAGVHVHQSTPSDSNIDVYASARRYAADVYGIDMDLTLLSIGADGHVASLFPSLWDPHETSSVIAVDGAPKPPSQRVSFSMKKIDESARVWILASGALKSSIVNRLMAGDSSIPATFARGSEETLLFTDFLTE